MSKATAEGRSITIAEPGIYSNTCRRCGATIMGAQVPANLPHLCESPDQRSCRHPIGERPQAMNPLEQALSFVHKTSQRTGYVTDGPCGTYDHDGPRDERGRKQYIHDTVFYAVKWDDTGEDGEAYAHEIEWIPATKRHITDGVRPCWCNPRIDNDIIIHNTEADGLN